MKKLVLVVGLILGLSAMAEDASVASKIESAKKGVVNTLKKAEEKAGEIKNKVEEKVDAMKADAKKDATKDVEAAKK